MAMQGRASQIDGKSIGQGNHAGQLAREIDVKIDTKSIQNRCRKSLRGTQTRREIDPATLSGRNVSPNNIPGPSQERFGTSLARGGRARKAPKGAPGRQKERPGAPRSAPRRPKSMPSRVRERKNRDLFARFVRKAPSGRFFDDFRRFSSVSQSLQTL